MPSGCSSALLVVVAVQDGIHDLPAGGDHANLSFIFAVYEVGKGLGHQVEMLERFYELLIPFVIVVQEIIRLYDIPRHAGFGRRVEGLKQIEISIVIGKFFARIDIADSQLEIVSRGNTVGVVAMVDKAGVVPTKNIVAVLISVSIFINDIPEEGLHIEHILGMEYLIEGIESPGDGASRNELRGNDANPLFRADKLKFCGWMYHGVFDGFYML